jgi:ATP-dependent Clp protease protease subunit
MLKIRDVLFNITAKHTGKKYDTIKKDSDRDYYMSADEAMKYGIIDKVMERLPDADSK